MKKPVDKDSKALDSYLNRLIKQSRLNQEKQIVPEIIYEEHIDKLEDNNQNK